MNWVDPGEDDDDHTIRSLTVIGHLAVATVAAAVLLFAVLEVVGLRRLREAAP